MGLIPAHAGKTSFVGMVLTAVWAHPRSRGENIWGSPTAGTYKGSSPLTRGKRQGRDVGHRSPGLIPAHAGKTSPWLRPWPPRWAHPRSRGENLSTGAGPDGQSGSSPLTRGKLEQEGSCAAGERLIPAHAGKTRETTSSACPARAHPRSRGENLDLQPHPRAPAGSSPLTRGKHQRHRC